MQDNFSIHEWQLNEKIKGLDGKGCWKGYKYAGTENGKDKCIPIKEEKQLCEECGEGYMEEGQCMECGYMEEGATFTDKHDDNPELKGGQKDLPDELQAGILKKEDTTGYSTDYKKGYRDGYQDGKEGKFGKQFAVKEGEDHENSLEDIISDMLKYMSKEEILQHFKQMLANNLNENTDHEVSMAQASLKSIISSASELMNKIGNEEINLPGWIQGHITNAENYIDQANQGYHEL